MITITKERFEAWLFSQPRERSFCYWSNQCLVGSFLSETCKGDFGIGGTYFVQYDGDRVNIPLPKWLFGLTHVRPLSIGAVQDAFPSIINEGQTDSLADSSVTPTQEGCLNVSCKTIK